MQNKIIYLIYDKQCPICDNYCQKIRIEESVGKLVLIDARYDSEQLREITAKNLDIDQGMVLKVEDSLFYGGDAIHALALMSGRSNYFNLLNFWLFRSVKIAKIIYPILRFGRSILLKCLSKTKINNLDIAGNNRF